MQGNVLTVPLDFSKFLSSQLRKAVMDHVSDSFLETNVPLLVLIEAAKNGNEKEVKEYAQVFREHANKLIEVNPQSKSDLTQIQNVSYFSSPSHWLWTF